MKRSVAIFGPTPQFVRWAIAHPCPLRSLDLEKLPDTTFRQLRGLRELSNGVVENRIVESICLHPDSTSTEVESARGFPAEEILEAFGSHEQVQECCGDCPANAVSVQRPGIWAGCYGWLPANGVFQLEVSSTAVPASEPDGSVDLIELMDLAIRELDIGQEIESLFLATVPNWYGIWQKQIIKGNHAAILLRIFNEMVRQVGNQSSESQANTNLHLLRFRDALQKSVQHELDLYVELLPPGNSDGQTWTLFSHCPNCKQQADDFDSANPLEQTCTSCGRVGHPHGRRKSKVLGVRPYMHLCRIVGNAKTLELLKRYENQKYEDQQ